VKWLLDANVLSENVRPQANQNVTAWISGQSRNDMAVSIITIAEIREGIESDADEAKRRQLTQWFESADMLFFREQTIRLDDRILIDWLRLSRRLSRRQIARQAPDLLIASTARVHNLIIVTRNVRHFAETGTTVYNPWTNETHQMEAP
jgi:predicted nucleic acid-binding protein